MIKFQHFLELEYNTSSTLKMKNILILILGYRKCSDVLSSNKYKIIISQRYGYQVEVRKIIKYKYMFLKKIIFVENFKAKRMNIMQRFCLWRISDLLPIKSYVTKGLSLQIPELS